jgi:predicted hydrocarbon binding protein
MVLEYLPGENVVMGVVELKDVVGALADAVTVVAKMGLNLSFSKTFKLSGDKVAIWSFMGIAGPHADAESIEKALRGSPKVVSCEIQSSDRGLISNDLQFPLLIAEERRGILLSPRSLVSMFSRVTKLLGSGGKTLLYEEGEMVGRDWAMTIQQLVSKERARELEPMALGVFSAMGWGKLQVLERDPASPWLVVSLEENFEAVGVNAAGPNCQFSRGMIAGGFSVLVGQVLPCVEAKCIAAGDDACVFVLGRSVPNLSPSSTRST